MRTTCGLLMLAGGVLISVASHADAALIVFENPAFSYRLEAWTPPFTIGNELDITHAAAKQHGDASLGVHWHRGFTFSSTDVAPDDLLGNPGAFVAAGTTEFRVMGGPNGDVPFFFLGARVYTLGESVGSDADFRGHGASLGAHGGSAGQHWFLGEDAYVGVRLTMSDRFHYGWVRMRLTRDQGGTEYQPVSWGYESTPDTPALVPAMHTMGSVGVLGIVVAVRRCRGRDRAIVPGRRRG